MKSIKAILKKIEDLPPMPAIASKLMRLTSDMDTNIETLIDHIERDQALTAKMLRLCNSSYYGMPRRIASIRQAVVLLGFNTIFKLVITSSSSLHFSRGAKGYGLSAQELWRHSVGTALSCEILARKFRFEKTDAAYTAGLLHDLGKVVLTEFVQEELEKIIEAVHAGRSFLEAEREILGMDHAQIGGKLARLWKFPEEMIEAIKYHHEPHLATAGKDLATFTHLANVVSQTIGIGNSVDSFYNRISEKVLKKYPLGQQDVSEIIETTVIRVEEAEEFIRETIGASQ